MSVGLSEQLSAYRDHFDEAMPAVSLDEIVADRGVLREQRRSGLAGWAIAAAVGVIALLVVGSVALLNRGSGDVVDQPIATTEAVDAVSTTTPPATTVAPLDLSQIDLPVVATATTPSSIGDLHWTVYEGSIPEEVDAQLTSVFVADNLPLDPRLYSTSGLLVPDTAPWRVTSLATAGGRELRVSYADVDWIETTLNMKGTALRTESSDGELLAPRADESGGTVEVHLFATRDDAIEFLNRGWDGYATPVAQIATFELDTRQQGDRWVTDVVDGDTGEPVGSISAAFAGSSGFEIFTISSADSFAVVDHPWSVVGHTEFAVFDDTFYAFHTFHNGEGPATVWTSTDGVTWDDRGTPAGWPFEFQSAGVSSFANYDGALVAVLVDEDENHFVLHSEDGLNWLSVDNAPGVPGDLRATSAGLVYVSDWYSGLEAQVWTSPDGVTWMQVDTGDLPMPKAPVGGGGGNAGAAEDGFFLSAFGDGEPTRLWIVQLTGGQQ